VRFESAILENDALAEVGLSRKLEMVVFFDSNVDDASMKDLLQCRQLRQVALIGTDVTSASFQTLEKMELSALYIGRGKISAEDIANCPRLPFISTERFRREFTE
jgi:hypothetical protein